ncbi:hypothetical protein BDY21DRAFT_336945 [Lineolata rhizophorae]|uniref:Uncharacterized protein n=1 Tax=Lineolata rhizophorae TaxID=578093 RepID=A0A6A6P7S9_9PEZI|nr:hypothetical protein BDY21DRAFT_336945 [Lineolata rhizophorae]
MMEQQQQQLAIDQRPPWPEVSSHGPSPPPFDANMDGALTSAYAVPSAPYIHTSTERAEQKAPTSLTA